MFDWFYNWLDPKILKLERWVNKKVIEIDKIDIDLDKIKTGEVKENPMFRTPPDSGDHGPFITNLSGGEVVEYLSGPGELEAFALIRASDGNDESLWWRHRDAGTTEDFRHPAFSNMQQFFEYAIGDSTKYWDCVLRTKAMQSETD